MRKIYSVRAFLTLCILAVSSLIGGVSAQAQTPETWVATDITKLTDTDVFVIADVTSSCAMPTDKGTSAPTATKITLNADKTEITSTVSDNLKWTLQVVNGKYKFIPVEKSTTFLYCTNNNNGVKVGTGSDNLFEWDANNNKLKNVGQKRWLGVYNTQDWRCYLSASQTNIVKTVTKFYKLEKGGSSDLPTPAITVEAPLTMNIGETKILIPQATVNGEVISNPQFTYELNSNKIEIDDNGNVTAKEEGEVIITVRLVGTEEYNSTFINCTITVVDPNKPAAVVTPMLFKEVTSTAQLIEGGQYIVVCKEKNVAMTTVSKKGASVDVTVEEDGSIVTVPSSVVIYTMSNKNTTGDYFNLINGDGKYLGIGSSTDLATLTDSYNAKAQWKLDGNNGIACKSNVESTDTKRSILYKGTQFGHYANSNIGGDYAIVQLYRLEATATINEKIGYTTYYTDEKYQLPEGLTAYAVSEAQEAGAVVMTPAYEAGADVPANTALLLGGEAGTYGLPVLNKEVEAYGGENLLEGRRNADNVTNSAREDVLYYKLTLLNGENPGFYWGAADGAAFVMKSATTAYLAVPKSVAAANGFRLIMGEGDTTGIGSVTTEAAAQNAAIYTLSGVRVNAANTAGLPKGIYIVNGKTLLVK